jgi:hypothetical protein
VIVLCLAAALAACRSEPTEEPVDLSQNPVDPNVENRLSEPPPVDRHRPPPLNPSDPESMMELAASNLMLKFVGAEPGRMCAGIEVTRTREEALELAAELADRISAGEDFERLAQEYSDGPNYYRGGNLRIFRAGAYPAPLSNAVKALEIGEVSDPVETAYGIHLLRRNPIERIHARQILIMHEGSAHKPKDKNITRSKAAAEALSRDILTQLQDGGDFAELARQFSDDSSSQRGGDMGRITRFIIDDRFVAAAFDLDIDETSDVVETGYGYHIIQRYAGPNEQVR